MGYRRSYRRRVSNKVTSRVYVEILEAQELYGTLNLPCDVVHEEGSCSSSVVRPGDGTEGLLTSLETQANSVNHKLR